MRRKWQKKPEKTGTVHLQVASAREHPLIRRFTEKPEDYYSVTGYMCGIDWHCEIGRAPRGSTVYPSISALKQDHEMWEECGIVEVQVRIRRTITPGNDSQTE